MREQRSKKDEYQKALAAYGLAVKEFHKGEFEKAAESFKGFIEKFPVDREIVDRAKVYLSIALKRPKKEAVALKSFERPLPLPASPRSISATSRARSRSWRRPWISRRTRASSTSSWRTSIA